GSDSIIVTDTANQTVHVTSQGAGSITSGDNQVDFVNMEQVQTNSGADTYNVESGIGGMTLDGGANNDTFNLLGNDHGHALNLIGGDGNDQLNITDANNN